MKNNKYSLITSTLVSEGTKVLSYGIYCTKGSRVIASYHDISINKSCVQELVLQCNKLELSPSHLFDVVEDFIEKNNY